MDEPGCLEPIMCIFVLYIHLFYFTGRTARRTRQGLYKLLTMVDAGGIRTYVHRHVSSWLYHCALDIDLFCVLSYKDAVIGTCYKLQKIIHILCLNQVLNFQVLHSNTCISIDWSFSLLP